MVKKSLLSLKLYLKLKYTSVFKKLYLHHNASFLFKTVQKPKSTVQNLMHVFWTRFVLFFILATLICYWPISQFGNMAIKPTATRNESLPDSFPTRLQMPQLLRILKREFSAAMETSFYAFMQWHQPQRSRWATHEIKFWQQGHMESKFSENRKKHF